MIRDTSEMDRQVAGQRSRWPLVAGLAMAALVTAGVLVKPAIGRWSEADRSVDRSQLRFADTRRGELVHDIAVQGRIVAASRPTMYSPQAGIVSVRVRAGETVAAGQLLALVESPELQSRLMQERATLDALESELGRRRLAIRNTNLGNEQTVDLLKVRAAAAGRAVERNERMRAEGLINAIEFEKAEDELELATLELAHAGKKLALERDMLAFELSDAELRRERQSLVVREVERRVAELRIVAPFAGLVATVSVEDRDAVTVGQALVGVVDLGALEVEISIPETYADDAGPGVEAVLSIAGGTYPGELLQIAPEVRAGLVTGRVRFSGDRPEGLRQNQRVSTRLVLDRRGDVIKVPRGPFLESGGGRVVYVVDDRLARRRSVDIGVISVTEVEVVAGLEEGETIVLSDLGRFDGANTILLRN